jgi:putative methylase
MDRRGLERRLQPLAGFADPDPALEQYPTPADVAAHVVHLAALQGDLSRPVFDLGAGTGVLALGAALAGAQRIVGVERDPGALRVARENEAALAAASAETETGVTAPVLTPVSWVCGDAARPPVCPGEPAAVLMNPPFGAQSGSEGADRAFLAAAADLATVSYSLHNAGSRAFLDSFVADRGGEVTHAFAVEFDVDRQFDFHTEPRATIAAEAYRVRWSDSETGSPENF